MHKTWAWGFFVQHCLHVMHWHLCYGYMKGVVSSLTLCHACVFPLSAGNKKNLQLDLLAKPAAGAGSQLHILRVATKDQATGGSVLSIQA